MITLGPDVNDEAPVFYEAPQGRQPATRRDRQGEWVPSPVNAHFLAHDENSGLWVRSLPHVSMTHFASRRERRRVTAGHWRMTPRLES